MPSANYRTQPWTCKDYDEQECREQVVQSLTEHYSTVYDCVFITTAAAGAAHGLLIAAYQTGELRVFNWQRVCRTWLATRAQQGHVLSWHGHEGPVYAVAVLKSQGFGDLLVTAGDDGFVRIWRLADIIAEAAPGATNDPNASSTSSSQRQVTLGAAALVQLPCAQNQLGISAGSQPAAQVLAVDQQQQRLFAGGSDGGVHVIDVARLSQAAAQQQSSLAATAAAVTSLQGHAAGVLGLDFSAATQQLASSSEDGTIRLWDCSNCNSSPRCISILNPWDDDKPNQGVMSVNQPSELLRCVKSSAVTCVRLSSEGRFLVAGNAAGSLVLWNCMDQSVAEKKDIRGDEQKCVPQVLVLSPGLVTVAGTDKRVHQFTFQLESIRSFDVGPDSVFGIAAEPETGMLAVCGSKGCIDLLSEQGAVSGLLRPPASVLTS